MRFGISFFAIDTTLDPASMGRAMEERGFESLRLSEHSHISVSRRALNERAAFVESLTP